MIRERLARLWRRVLQASRRRAFDRELDEELAFHLAMKQAHGVADEAVYREMGNLMLAKENSREAWMFAGIEGALKDVRYALRVLRKSPVFTACAVLTLALGIGANAAIFTLIDALLLRALPVGEPERMIQISMQGDEIVSHFSYPMFLDLQLRTRSFSGIFTVGFTGFTTGWGVDSRHVDGTMMSGGAYQTMQIQPEAGRLITPSDDLTGAPLVAVISDAYWTREYQRDPGAIGRVILLNRKPFTIIGVTPPGFTGVAAGSNPFVTITMHANAALHPTWGTLDSKRSWYLALLARLKPGVTETQARAELRAISPAIMRDQGDLTSLPERRLPFLAQKLDLIPGAIGASGLADQYRKALFVLMAISGLVLLVACVNLASLSLARAVARQKELSVRLSLGAGRSKLMRQLLAESVVLSMLGAALGAFFAFWATRAMVAFMSTEGSPLVLNLNPDWRMLGFLALLAVLTGLLFGTAPAIQGTNIRLNEVLKQSRIGMASTSHSFVLGKALVSAQVGLSLLLMIGALLFVRTLANLKWQDNGFERNNVVFVELNTQTSGMTDEQLIPFADRLLAEVRRNPQVRFASFTNVIPIEGSYEYEDLPPSLFPGLSPTQRKLFVHRVSTEYFPTVGVKLLRGRDFTASDASAEQKKAILSAFAAQTLFPKGDPIGHMLRFNEKTAYEVIGVAADATYTDLRDRVPRTVYLQGSSSNLVVRSGMDRGALVSLVRSLLRQTGKDIALGETISLTEQIDRTLVAERLTALLASFFAALAAVLVAIGLYGVVGYTASRRTNEIGVRLALGATRPNVLWLVMREALVLAGIGVAVGVPVALVAGRVIRSMLFGVTSSDPGTLLVTILLMLAVAAIAGFLPARAASRLDPMRALRYE